MHFLMRYCRSSGLLKFTDSEGEVEEEREERIVLGHEEENSGVV